MQKMHRFTSSPLFPSDRGKNSFFSFFDRINLIKKNWGDPHHPFPSKMWVNFFQKMADDVRRVTRSSEQKSERRQLQRKKLPPEGGAVNNKPSPASSATSIKKPTTSTVIQKKKTSSNSTVDDSDHGPPKDITISSPSTSTIPTISTLSQKNSNNLLSLNSLWECPNIKRIPGPKGHLSMMECGYCKKISLSSHSHVASCFENSP